mgnify:CR=1 FL=1
MLAIDPDLHGNAIGLELLLGGDNRAVYGVSTAANRVREAGQDANPSGHCSSPPGIAWVEPIMSSFHGGWSIGAFTGAGFGALMAGFTAPWIRDWLGWQGLFIVGGIMAIQRSII